MKQGKKIPQPHSVQKLHSLSRIGALPRDVGLPLLDVAHDGWCGIVAGQRCDGHLAIKLQWSQPAAA
jgi:hypothetical protein